MQQLFVLAVGGEISGIEQESVPDHEDIDRRETLDGQGKGIWCLRVGQGFFSLGCPDSETLDGDGQVVWPFLPPPRLPCCIPKLDGLVCVLSSSVLVANLFSVDSLAVLLKPEGGVQICRLEYFQPQLKEHLE